MSSLEQQMATDSNEIEPAGGKMRAIVQDQYGETAKVLRLDEIDQPQIGDNDVLVRVKAAGVHIGDWHVMAGLPYLLRVVGFGFRAPKVRVRGIDLAGTVEAVGQNVTRFQVGNEVFGTCEGAFAEYAATPENTLALKPANLTFQQAAAVPLLRLQHSRLFATQAASRQASRSCSLGRPEESDCSRFRSRNRSALR